MDKEDSLQFMRERLSHHQAGGWARSFGYESGARIKRRFVVELAQGEAAIFERVDVTFQVNCARGSIWITQDGDCRDVILAPGEGYRAERDAPMHLMALSRTLLEIEFEDAVVEH